MYTPAESSTPARMKNIESDAAEVMTNTVSIESDAEGSKSTATNATTKSICNVRHTPRTTTAFTLRCEISNTADTACIKVIKAINTKRVSLTLSRIFSDNSAVRLCHHCAALPAKLPPHNHDT